MGYKNVGGFASNPLFDFNGKTVDAAIEGEFLGTRHIESIDSKMHSIKTADGKVWDFWGSGALNYKLAQVEKGSRVKITYKGIKKDVPIEMADKKGKTKTVKKDIHQYDVELWEETAAV
jgi:hypothetical protein